MAWESSNRRSTLPKCWPHLRNSILKRDGRVCQIAGPTCIGTATEVDHIEGHSDDPSNLRSTCHPCHSIRSSSQGGQAAGRARQAQIAARKRKPEAHPGLIGP